MSVGPTRMAPESFYFGSPEKPLFGCYHPPQSVTPQDCSVVLCSPIFNEYIWSHRIYRQVALRLSRVGFPVLRFDYYGCGDSGGEVGEGGIPQWCDDISTAVDQVKERNDSSRVCLVGMRFGATLAMLAGDQLGDVDGLVLWDPVVNGPDYLHQLNSFHQARLFHSHGRAGSGSGGDPPQELLGFPITDAMNLNLKSLNMLGLEQNPASKTLIINSDSGVDAGLLKEHLQGLGAQVDFQLLPDHSPWDANRMRQVPVEIIQAIVSWITGVYA